MHTLYCYNESHSTACAYRVQTFVNSIQVKNAVNLSISKLVFYANTVSLYSHILCVNMCLYTHST